MGLTTQLVRKPELVVFSNRLANILIITTFGSSLHKTWPHVSLSLNESTAHIVQSERGSAVGSAFWA